MSVVIFILGFVTGIFIVIIHRDAHIARLEQQISHLKTLIQATNEKN